MDDLISEILIVYFLEGSPWGYVGSPFLNLGGSL